NILNDQVVRGSKLVSNIRKLSQISETESKLEFIEIIQILKDAVKFIHKSYPEKDLSIHIDSPIEKIFIQANELLLDLFENILINAIKYNVNPKIEILIKFSKQIKNETKFIKIEFIDNGVGVPDAMKERIFGGIAPRKDKVHGMGLGLLLVKRIINNFNGQIWVEDKIKGDPSQGSNFILLIPEVV
ncbi:MAG: sensor histidine kinase, partial [Promethearchaeota archaeon]